VLLRALPAIAAEVPSVELDVVGAGPADHSLERLAATLGVQERVTFHGGLKGSILPFLHGAHVLVVPSRVMPDGMAEGSPVVTKEGQAAGVAVVATRSGGMMETLPPEHRADIVPSDDPEALARRVVALAGDPEGRRVRVREARAWVEREFDAAELGRRTLGLYERLIAAGTR
jgi:glycosyltransferase involved in cell wall biosynthesis